MSHNNIPDERNIREAQGSWESGIEFGKGSNTYKLMAALLSAADEIDSDLEDIYDSQHIDTAEGKDLDKFGNLVNLNRNQGEPDAKYRARIKAEFAQAKSAATWDDFVEFAATVLSTNVQNIEFSTNYDGNPATVVVSADPAVYDSAALTAAELDDVLGGGVAAGHEVQVQEAGTFRLKSDGDTDTAANGLTSDSISTGGTLAADIV